MGRKNLITHAVNVKSHLPIPIKQISGAIQGRVIHHHWSLHI